VKSLNLDLYEVFNTVFNVLSRIYVSAYLFN
jgi:hypothetical protein